MANQFDPYAYNRPVPSQYLSPTKAIEYLKSLNDTKVMKYWYSHYVYEMGYRGTTLTKINEAMETLKQYCGNYLVEQQYFDLYQIIDNKLLIIYHDLNSKTTRDLKKEVEPTDIIYPPDRTEPYQYNTTFDLLRLEIGETVNITFKNEKFRVPKEFKGQTIPFIVHSERPHGHRKKTKRLVLIKADKVNNPSPKDIIFLDDYDRFECLMIDLFPCNRFPYKGWKNRTVEVTKVSEFDHLLS